MAARLGELDRMKAEFLGMASHELKTPLNVISAYAELIEEGRGEDESERHRSLIAGLTEQAHLMSKLVGRLMDLSRLEAGAFELAPESVAVDDIITSLKRMFERIAKEQGVELRLGRTDDAPEEIVVDVDLLRDEVLGNLLSNALRYTPTGGWIEVLAHGGDGGVSFTVTDTGPGIPAEHRGAIFKKHYTVDRTRGVGAGLGLAIAKEMVELHGGLISLEDAPSGCGARFRVALPLAPVAGAGLPGAGPPPGGRLRAV
jgi:signal transduction histidine kinase